MAEKWLIIGISGVTCGGKTTLAKKLHETFPSSKLFSQDDYFLPVEDERHTWIPKLNHINFDILSSLDMEKMQSDLKEFLRDKVVYEMNEINGDGDLKDSSSTKILISDKSGINKDLIKENEGYKSIKVTNENDKLNTTQTNNLPQQVNTNGSSNELIKINSKTEEISTKENLESRAVALLEKLGINLCIVEGFSIFNYPPVGDFSQLKYFFELDYTECQRRRSLRVYDPPDCEGYFEECVWIEYQKQLDEVKTSVENVVYFNGKMSNSLQKVLCDLINFVS